MKKEILKIAGVKSEKEFYKKFPDEASFMKAHGKEFKKAMREANVEKAQGGVRQLPSAREIGQQLTKDYPLPTVPNINAMMKPVKVPQSALTPKQAAPMPKLGKAAQFIDPAMDIAKGIGMIKQQRQEVRAAKQMRDLTGVQAAAMASMPVQPPQNQYVTPWDKKTQPNQLFPSYGVGTNVLAEDGAVIGGNPTEITNTFAPNTIYSDMGYEPLSDSDKVKQYFYGGGIPTAQYGFDIEERQSGVGKFLGNIKSGIQSGGFQDFMNQGGSEMLDKATTAITGEPDAGTQIGGGLGEGLGKAFFGPVGGTVGKFAGKLIGDLVDRSDVKIRKAKQQTEKNVGSMIGSQFASGLQGAFSANVRNGGYVPMAQDGKLTYKDGKCSAEEARNKEFSAMDKEAAKENKAWDKQVARDNKEAARLNAQELANYLDEGLTGYGDKIKKKDFESAYQAFAAQNPELAKDRLLYTLANKEFNKVRNNPDYRMRGIFNRVDPNLDYKTLTLPQLMQTMQKGFGSGQGYYDAWKDNFPMRAFPQPVPVQQQNGGQTSDYEWISHTWQPQVITHFGDYSMRDLLRPPHDADMLRTGGSVRQNYIDPEEEMLTNMSLGGQIQTTWGGYAEPISHNPYMPSTGQTVMFRGQSHDESDGKGRTGIGVKYGKPDSYTDYAEYGTNANADVEVERNEPAIEMPNKDGDNSMVVFGNLKVPNQFLHEIGDPKAKGKKFKSYVKDLSKKEQRQNKKIDNASQKLDSLDPNSPFDKLKLNSLQATIMGANMKLKQFAEFKQNAAAVQSAINDTAEEMGLVADDLARGKVKIDKKAFQEEARYGKSVKKAQGGITTPAVDDDVLVTDLGETITKADLARLEALYKEAEKQKTGDKVVAFQQEFHRLLPKTALKYNKETGSLTAKAKNLGVTKADLAKIDINNPEGSLEKLVRKGNEDGFFGKITKQYMTLAKSAKSKPKPKFEKVTPITGTTPAPANKPVTYYPMTQYRSNPYSGVISELMNQIRPSDVEQLDPRQFTGELYALSQNQVEPVWAQKIQPRLNVPVDISYQDILNENEATYRGQQQLFGYNPAAQSSLAAQKYAANQKVLAEQFRLNQAEKNRVYEQNRNILNEYDLKNLGILDQQYVRQNEALSKTKATTQEALNSISSKILQNRLENRTLATMENMYGFRFDPRFRAINYQTGTFNIPTVYTGPDGKYYKTNQTTGQLEEIKTPNIGANFTIPSIPTIQKTSSNPPLATPMYFPGEPTLLPEDLKEYPNEGRKGLSVKKKKEDRNSSIVKALKNL